MSLTIVLVVGFFALGAIIASFLGVVAERWGTGESWLAGRSRCDSCGHELGAAELVPVCSWLSSRGRCRACGSHISARSTLAEAVLGGLFALAFLQLGTSVAFAVFLVALALLTLIVLYDLRHTLIPGMFSTPFVLVSVVFAALIATDVRAFAITFLTAAGLALVLAAMHFASRGRAMGLADAPITFALALLAGPLAFSGFVYSFWVGALVGVFILARAPRGHRMGIEVPFAPFLAAGFLLAFFTGWNLFMLL
ncbi:MAG TPA: prepilin peptidase [Candidatus Paceibacterota bacterium]